MPNSISGSESFDYIQNFQVARKFFDRFFPYFILVSDDMRIIDCGRLWSRFTILSNLNCDFRLKTNVEPFSKEFFVEKQQKRIGLKHVKSDTVFWGEFIQCKEKKFYLGVISPRINSTEMVRSLRVSATDFSANDNTLDSALLFQTQKIILKDNIKLIEELLSEQQKIQDFNTGLEEIIATRTLELDMVKAQSINNARLAALGEMASGIAHEIHNPLAIISSSAMMLKRMQESDELTKDKLNDVTDNIQTTVRRISKIINAIRNLSQNSSEEELVVVNLRQVLQDVLDFHMFKFRSQNILLEFNLESKEFDVGIMGNFIQLTQVFTNLLANSASAIESLQKKWIRVSLYEDEEFLYVTVIDSGPGIPLAIQDKIFNPFFTTKAPDKGTGLGLTISHKIIEKLGGSLTIDNKLKNTCFIVKLLKA